MGSDTANALIQFLPLVLITIAFAIGNGFLAVRLDRNAPMWVILSLIPIVNFWFGIYVAYQVVFFVIDRLKGTSAKPAA
jgi:hypothetical protein